MPPARVPSLVQGRHGRRRAISGNPEDNFDVFLEPLNPADEIDCHASVLKQEIDLSPQVGILLVMRGMHERVHIGIKRHTEFEPDSVQIPLQFLQKEQRP